MIDRITRPAIEVINELIVGAVPFKLCGRSPEEGFDCLGVGIYYYLHVHGIQIFDPLSIDPEAVQQRAFMEQWTKIEESELECGVHYKTLTDGYHLGVNTPHGVLHSGGDLGVVCTPMRKFRLSIRGFYRNKIYAERLGLK